MGIVKRITGINFEAPTMLDDLEFWDKASEDELIARFKLSYADDFGIYDLVDPSSATETENRPLVISPNSLDPLLIDVKPGIAVTKSGYLIQIENTVPSLSMPSLVSGDQFVVYLEAGVLEDPESVRISRYTSLISARRIKADDEDLVKILSLSQWSAKTQDELLHLVSLAVVKVTLLNGVTTLVIDLGQASHEFNRPWFSTVDMKHRSRIGSGLITPSNPHGMSINDLTISGLSLWQLELKNGLILSKVQGIPNTPGKPIRESFTRAEIFQNQGMITLSRYPIRFGGIRTKVNPREDGSLPEPEFIAFSPTDGTNQISIPPFEYTGNSPTIPEEGVEVYYTAASSLEPPSVLPVPGQITLLKPVSGTEAIFSGGAAVGTMSSQPSIDLRQSGPIAHLFHAVAGMAGEVFVTPQVLICYKLISSIETSPATAEFGMRGPGKVRVGLTRASGTPTMKLKLRVQGVRTDGVSVSEVLEFSSSNWLDQSVPATSMQFGQFKDTLLTFFELTSIVVDEAVDLGINAAVIVYGLMSPETSDEVRDSAYVAKLFWDGTRISRYTDCRKVVTSLDKSNMPSAFFTAKAIYASRLSQEGALIRGVDFEDFSSPRHMDFFNSRLLELESSGRSNIGLGFDGISGENQAVYYSSALMPPKVVSRIEIYPLYASHLTTSVSIWYQILPETFDPNSFTNHFHNGTFAQLLRTDGRFILVSPSSVSKFRLKLTGNLSGFVLLYAASVPVNEDGEGEEEPGGNEQPPIAVDYSTNTHNPLTSEDVPKTGPKLLASVTHEGALSKFIGVHGDQLEKTTDTDRETSIHHTIGPEEFQVPSARGTPYNSFEIGYKKSGLNTSLKFAEVGTAPSKRKNIIYSDPSTKKLHLGHFDISGDGSEGGAIPDGPLAGFVPGTIHYHLPISGFSLYRKEIEVRGDVWAQNTVLYPRMLFVNTSEGSLSLSGICYVHIPVGTRVKKMVAIGGYPTNELNPDIHLSLCRISYTTGGGQLSYEKLFDVVWDRFADANDKLGEEQSDTGTFDIMLSSFSTLFFLRLGDESTDLPAGNTFSLSTCYLEVETLQSSAF